MGTGAFTRITMVRPSFAPDLVAAFIFHTPAPIVDFLPQTNGRGTQIRMGQESRSVQLTSGWPDVTRIGWSP